MMSSSPSSPRTTSFSVPPSNTPPAGPPRRRSWPPSPESVATPPPAISTSSPGPPDSSTGITTSPSMKIRSFWALPQVTISVTSEKTIVWWMGPTSISTGMNRIKTVVRNGAPVPETITSPGASPAPT